MHTTCLTFFQVLRKQKRAVPIKHCPRGAHRVLIPSAVVLTVRFPARQSQHLLGTVDVQNFQVLSQAYQVKNWAGAQQSEF